MATCQGMTTDGDRCKLQVKDGEEYCWIHKLSVKSEKDNTNPGDLGHQEAQLNKRGLIVPKWLREAVVGNIISTILIESALEVGRVLKAISKQNRDNEQSVDLPVTPLPLEAPTPPSRSAPESISTPTPESLLERIRAGRIKNLAGAQLEGVNLKEARLYKINLENANLARANLRKAILIGANLREANLEGARLEGANLEGANLEGTNLSCIIYNDATIWPKGVNPDRQGSLRISGDNIFVPRRSPNSSNEHSQ